MPWILRREGQRKKIVGDSDRSFLQQGIGAAWGVSPQPARNHRKGPEVTTGCDPRIIKHFQMSQGMALPLLKNT